MITEQYRERWRRLRREMHLADPEAVDFGTGGLSRFLDSSGVRMLILPRDPESIHIGFDQEFWAWWLPERTDPATGRPTKWGSRTQPTASAAVRGIDPSRERCERYIALHRNGALEMGLGTDGLYAVGEKRIFRLVPIVGRVWAAIALYREAAARFAIEGPWEVVLALPRTAGTLLGQLGNGWPEPTSWENSLPPCREAALLLRRELEQWPDEKEAEGLAFGFGGWLEDAWGVRDRRFLAQEGEFTGRFDQDRYHWY